MGIASTPRMKTLKPGIAHRFGRAVALQLALVAVAAVLGTWGAGWVMKEILVKQALETEAHYFWKSRKQNPDFNLPDTRNLTGFLSTENNSSLLPADLQDLDSGFHELPSQSDYSVALVSQKNNEKLVLLFDGEQVHELTLYFGLLPLGVVLVLVYCSIYLGYRFYRSSVSPVISLAKKVESLDLESVSNNEFKPETLDLSTDREIVTLTKALDRLTKRVREFISRERDFTRDVSHELRSPLTVISIACDMLLTEQELVRPAKNSVHRIKRAADDMKSLAEAFLLLARESDGSLTTEPVNVNELLAEEAERFRPLLEGKPVELNIKTNCQLEVNAPSKVLSVIISNFLGNAVMYTDTGTIDLIIDSTRLIVQDSGIGMEVDDKGQAFKPYFRGSNSRRGGHGVGLSIVKKLSDRFSWQVDLTSEPGVGTTATLHMPQANYFLLETPLTSAPISS